MKPINRVEKDVNKFSEFAKMCFKPQITHSNKIQSRKIERIDEKSPFLKNYQVINKKINNQDISPQKSIEKSSSKSPSKNKQIKVVQLDHSQINHQQAEEGHQKDTIKKTTFAKICYIQKLGDNMLLIGNQNQIDFLQLTFYKNQTNGDVYTQYYWSLSQPQGPIKSITLSKQVKKQNRIIALAAKNSIMLYLFLEKQFQKQPKKILQQDFGKEVVKIDFLKRRFLAVYFVDEIHIYKVIQPLALQFKLSPVTKELYSFSSGQEKTSFTKQNKTKKQGQNNQKYLLYDISKVVDNCVKIFFTEKVGQQQSKRTFTLYFILVTILDERFRVSSIRKIYDLKHQLKKSLTGIHNYNKQIVVINLGSQLIALKRGLVIDNANVNFRQSKCFLKYIQQKDQIVHVQKDRIQVYQFYLSTQFNPEKIIINAKDSIMYSEDCDGQFLTLISFNLGYSVFFQIPQSSKSITSKYKGMINYWFCLPYSLKVNEKLQEIFPTADQIQQIKNEQIQKVSDMATKMGLTIKQAYLQIWKRSKKNTKKSFDILLLTQDFDIILNQIESACRKALKYRDVSANFEVCQKFLSFNIFNQNCTEKEILDYLRCRFLILKLQTYIDLEIYRKQFAPVRSLQVGVGLMYEGPLKEIMELGRNYSPIKSQKKQGAFNQQGLLVGQQYFETQAQKKQHIIGIKAFKYYKQINLKALFLSQIGQFLYNTEVGDHITVIRFFIKNFQIIYRIIYEELLVKVIQQHKFHLLTLLQYYPQLLPTNDKVYLKYHKSNEFIQTLWTPIDKNCLSRNVFLHDLQIIDNRDTIKKIPNNIWIKRNLYTFHGLIDKKSNLILESYNSLKQKQQYFYIFYAEIMKVRYILQEKLKVLQFQRVQRQETYTQKQIKLNLKRLAQTIQYVQHNYKLLPGNLRHYSQIYYILYFKKSKQLQEFQKYTIQQFLQLTNYQLFKFYFINEKKGKGYIFHEQAGIYKLYQDELAVKGRKIFRKGIQQYFLTEKENQISDIKLILNRFNSKDKDFQMKNEKLFVVLINCLMKIIRIGIENQVNLENQILIYIRDVCFNVNNKKLIDDLRYLNRLSRQIEILQAISIDMTILDILQKGEQVLSKIVNHMIKKHKIRQSQTYESFHALSYLVVSHANSFRAQIYDTKHKAFLYFLYFSEVMKQQKLIQFAIKFLKNDDYMSNFFKINNEFFKSLFFYMYNWCLSQEKVNYQHINHNPFNFRKDTFQQQQSLYLNHESYIQQILQLVNKNDRDRKFVDLEMQYVKIFKQLGKRTQQSQKSQFKKQNLAFKITYPISMTYEVPTLNQIYTHILSGYEITKMDISYAHKMFQILDKMRSMFQPNVKEDQNLTKKKNWFLKQIFEIFFCKLIKDKQLKQALKIVFEIEKIPNQQNLIIYPILIIDAMLQFFGQASQILLIQLIPYYYYDAKELTKIIQDLLIHPMTTVEFDKRIEEYIAKKRLQKKYKEAKESYIKNVLFKKQFTQRLRQQKKHQVHKKKTLLFLSQVENHKKIKSQNDYNQEQYQLFLKFQKILSNTFTHLLSAKQQFRKNKSYRIIFKVLCHSPYSISKFLFCKQKSFNLKHFRAFFSFMVHQVVFQPAYALIVGSRILQIMLVRMRNNMTMDQIIKYEQDIKMSQALLFQQDQINCFKQSEVLIYESIKIIDKKVNFYLKENLKQKIRNNYQIINKQYQRKQILLRQNLRKRLSRGQINQKDMKKSLSTTKNLGLKSNQQLEITIKKISVEDMQEIQNLNNSKQNVQKSFQNQPTIQKYQKFVYLNPDQFFDNPDIINQIIPSKYLFIKDQDDGYQDKQCDQLIWDAHADFKINVPFDQISKRHQIFQNKKNTRFQGIPDQTEFLNIHAQLQKVKSSYFQQTVNAKNMKKSYQGRNNSNLFSIDQKFKKGSSLHMPQIRKRQSQISSPNSIDSDSQLSSPARFKNLLKRRKRLIQTDQFQSPQPKKKLSIKDLKLVADAFQSTSFHSKQGVTDEMFQIFKILLQIAAKCKSKQSIKQQFENKYKSVLTNFKYLQDLKGALRIFYKREQITAMIRIQVIKTILDLVNLQNYVPEYLQLYEKASQIDHINILQEQFSQIFPFEGIFYSQKIHNKRLRQENIDLSYLTKLKQQINLQIGIHDQNQNTIQNEEYENVSPITYLRTSIAKDKLSLNQRLYSLLITHIKPKLNVMNVNWIAQIIESTLQSRMYFKLIYFQLIEKSVSSVIEQKHILNFDDQQIKQIQGIQHLIECIEDDQFLNNQLNLRSTLKNQQRNIIHEINVKINSLQRSKVINK